MSADGAVLPGVIARRNRNGDLASRSATILTKNEIVIKLGAILKVGKRVQIKPNWGKNSS